jgi:glutathione S-transferase
MAEKLTIWTYDCVPAGPRGFVRDLRLRWAAEGASLAYDVRTVVFEDRETNHVDSQPFGAKRIPDWPRGSGSNGTENAVRH